jgi:hypothetical protein
MASSTCAQAKQQFLASSNGHAYGYKGWLDQHWWAEIGQRLGPGAHYLDMTGKPLNQCCYLRITSLLL